MRLILLTEQEFVDAVVGPLRAAVPHLVLRHARTLGDLEGALAAEASPARILSMGSGVIVPGPLLAQLLGPAYNLHPGPPQYPGLFPSVFALYDGAKRFGVTLHEMTAKVDAGPIVAVDEFAIDPAWDRLALDTVTFAAVAAMLTRLAPQLAAIDKPLARTKHTWSGRCRTRKDFDELCHVPADATAEEFARRYRAVGEGPEHALTLTRFSRKFRLESETPGEVVRGGQPVKK